MTTRHPGEMLEELVEQDKRITSITLTNTKLRAALRTITVLLDPDNEVRDHMTATSAYEVAVEALKEGPC